MYILVPTHFLNSSVIFVIRAFGQFNSSTSFCDLSHIRSESSAAKWIQSDVNGNKSIQAIRFIFIFLLFILRLQINAANKAPKSNANRSYVPSLAGSDSIIFSIRS
ncbi:hypothetical protein DERP_004797 [Dermatophagoides pteronyssinus]|uniref:Uncharacterized protein n=1 Tax=Dermatophagoides pteronyssinus TaxID=6956 RepID=A0ABQ8JT50_DERPT|nr:hypothetical protein DERP_004797 [Dermatophagoides pteronyssinus]